MAQRQRFSINTEPHVAEVGDDEFHFKPEVYTDELLDAWAELRTIEKAEVAPGEDPKAAAERIRKANEATKGFLAEMMLEESASKFLGMKLPDRVTVELMRWILGVYGLRPTTSSNGSSESSPTTTPGDASMEPSSSEVSTS